MNCYLSWNLKDMTNISAEKLQKNISQQTSYIQLYRSELTKEAFKFNIGSLLRHVCTERSSFGTEPIQRRATDCLIIFLHAAAFQKVTYFAPTDAENPAVAKCARNLHRLMLENVKSTMRFIDYEVLQKHARGEIDTSELFSEREKIHSSVFPDESLLPVSDNEGLNNEFLKLIEMETRKARTFVDFDVQRNTSIDTALCQKLAKVPRSETTLPDSRYGLIGSCRSSLETPFIRYGNCYYSFVTAYSLRTIAETVSQFAKDLPVAPVPVVEEPVEEEQSAEVEPEVVEPEVIEPEIEEPAEDSMALDVVEPVDTVDSAEPADVAEPVEAAEPEEVTVPVEEEPMEEEPVEEEPEPEVEPEPEPAETPEPTEITETSETTVPTEIQETTINNQPEETEEDIPFEEPEEPEEAYEEPEMSEASEEEEDDDQEEPEAEETPVEEPVIEQMASDDDEEEELQDDPFEDDEETPEEDEKNYTALVSPDAYDYLKDSEKEDFKHDPMLDEQDYENWYDDDDDDEEQASPAEDDEPDPYSGESLFSFMDDSDDGEPAEEEKREENVEPIQSEWFPTDDEEVPPPEPEPEPEDAPAEEEAVEEELPEEQPEEEITEEEEPTEEVVEPVEEESEPEEEPEPEPVVEQPAEQPLPLLEQILSFAPSKNNPIVQYLSTCQYEQKKELVRFIELARKAWLIDGKDKVFSIPDTTISVAVFAQTQDPMLIIQRRENIGAVMYASQKDYWNSLEISYDGSGQMVKADYIRISRNTFSDWEWKVVEKLGTRLLERRGK